MRSTILHSLLASMLLLSACGDTTGNQNNNSPCPEGYEQSGPACIPIFDDCPGVAEIPVLGGGCQAVGVTTCATGLFESDGEGGCEPILPDHSCPPGTMEMLGQTECQPVGVTECAAGFESDGEGGCNVILPTDPCPSGTIALLGHTTCQPLGSCGTGTWGDIVDDSTTVFVDQTADATGANGSQQTPFLTVGEALAVVQPGGQIAVAAGDYTERLNINQPVRFTGRCVALVTIRGQVFLGDPKPPVTIVVGGTGTTIQGVTLTGQAEGLVISGAKQVNVQVVEVLDTGSYGISVTAESEVSLSQVKVVGSSVFGIISEGGTLELFQSVVRDSRADSDGRFGWGIGARCAPDLSLCGSLGVTSSLVSGNLDIGIVARGVDTTVTATVVRDTLPQESDGTGGWGVEAQCSSTGTCGSLSVTNSLVSGNRHLGIAAFGVESTVTSTVVRDTLPQESDASGGWGISAQCDSDLSICGSLNVTNSLVSGGRDKGISAVGVDTVLAGTVVRDTLPRDSDGTGGWGIAAECDPVGGTCGSFGVTSSLVSGNRHVGLLAHGVDTTVTTTVVRDTLPQASDGMGGRGINAECNSSLSVCGSLVVASSLVSGNRYAGIIALGAPTTVTGSVVRGTLADTDGLFGHGVGAQCHPTLGICGSMSVTGSLVSENRYVGILAQGVDTTVTGSVVRATQARESDGRFGRGINAQCDPDHGICGSLGVTSSLVSGNTGMGIDARGVSATVTGSVVRDTLARESDRRLGVGIVGDCDPELGICGSLGVTSSLVSGNRGAGILAQGVDTDVTGTAVRDTLAQEIGDRVGRGINAQCAAELLICGSLRVTDSLVQASQNTGIFIGDVPAVLEGVAVVDTIPDLSGSSRGEYGQGIWATCDMRIGDCATLQMTSCLVDSSHSGGVALEGASGFIASSVVRSVTSQPLDDKYGYGIQIGGLEGEEMPTFNVNNCEVRDAKLAGVLYYRARGVLSGSVVSGGENSVVMNEGSEPTIMDNNDLSGTVTSEPTWANLFPSPAPAPALPLEPIE